MTWHRTPFADCLVIGRGQRGRRRHTRSLVSHTRRRDGAEDTAGLAAPPRRRAASHKTFYGQKGKRGERASVCARVK